MCEIRINSCGEKRLFTTDNEQFRLATTGCGQGIAVFNANGVYVTAIALEKANYTSAADLEVICAALTSIKATKWLRKSKKRLERLREDIAARMAAKGIEGEVLQPIT